jgi:hypothetical protein
MVSDDIEATVEVTYSNIGREWIASLVGADDNTLAFARAKTRADALRLLADEIEGES